MDTNARIDALVLGCGPGALSIASALGKENLKVGILSETEPHKPWPFTYGIWGEEVDQLGLSDLLEHRWSNTVSFFGEGSKHKGNNKNFPTNHARDYGLFDKVKLQQYWINQCKKFLVTWHIGKAIDLKVDTDISTVTTSKGLELTARLIIDATGYKPAFLQIPDEGPIAVQTCYGIVGEFSSPPVDEGQFVLMDYRCDHLTSNEKLEPPTFLYAMDFGSNKFFLEETSLGLAPPLSLEVLKSRLNKRLEYRGIKLTKLEYEELGVYLPMNMPIPSLDQPILSFGGAAGMVHPASGYLVGSLLRRAPVLAKAIAKSMEEKSNSPEKIAQEGWKALWPKELIKKKALYTFGLEKLMRFEESQLREFFIQFFKLPNNQWYGFLTNTLSLNELINSMWSMFKKAPWSVKWGLMAMQGKELKLLWKFIKP
ncbi:lycopene beta cyclase [Prochlorococcus sp. MIT 1223]|uniref:lycopene beta cyclase n=1 Tax=Prochlorococcus sp. MIT 1223 TaxID=3096217 RepID=UPI002A74D1DF|nr:lycopene cyclase family protein [Prochlorococcus sp. MIT 1223]